MTVYYLSNGGSDVAAGTSPAAAWATVARLNTALDTGSINVGDEVRFRCGDTFYGSPVQSGHFSYPSSTAWLTYGSYGLGPKPILSNYKIGNLTGGWVDQGNNVWRIDLAANSGAYTGNTAGTATDVGHLRVNGIIYGRKRNSLGALSGEWDFFSGVYGSPSQYLYVKRTGNPAAAGPVFISTGDDCIINVQRHRTRITGLELVGGDGGIYGNAYWAPHDVEISNCDIHDLGGAYISGYGTPTRLGNGVQAWIGNNDWNVHHNRIWNVYDVAFTCQGTQGTQVASNRGWSNIRAHHNRIWNCGQSIELWSSGTDGPGFVGCSFADNLCFNAGGGWGHAVRPDPQGRGCHVLLYQMQLPAGFVIERNVFFGAATNYLFPLNGIPAGLTMRNNAVYLAPGTLIQDSTTAAGQRSEVIGQAAAWAAATGQEQGSSWFSDRAVADAYLLERARRSGQLVSTLNGLRQRGPDVTWPSTV